MKKAFTLLELLVVVAIMGFMGALAVNGYRAMRRGMEERSVMQNVNQFIRSAYQRAQIDRLPVAVYFWNETLRAESSDAPPIVVGRAVAVRRAGRLTKVQGGYLFDEFGDLRFNRFVLDEDEDSEIEASGSGDSEGVALYQMNGNEGNAVKRSIVSETTQRFTLTEPLLMSSSGQSGQGQFETYAYVVLDMGGVSWKIGDAYGFEFAELQLPHGYIFGSNWSKSTGSPVAGETAIRFRVSANSGSGATQGTSGSDTIIVSSLRPSASGGIEAEKVSVSDSPTKSLSN